MRLLFTIFIFLLGSVVAYNQTKMPPPISKCYNEPIKYVGKRQTNPKFYDGGLPHVVGVHSYQAFHADREHPTTPGDVGWTYNHQPYLCYWNNKFYLEFLSDVIGENVPPGRTLLMWSKDGSSWTDPVVVFPIYSLPQIVIPGKIFVPAGTKAVMHQRMGFYIAPNGMLLVSGFYGYCPSDDWSPNTGNGLGRVVREVHKDGTFGPIYFIRYNRHAGFNETNTNYPFYKTSKDTGFVNACNALLSDKLKTLQWWEEDRAKDGFFSIDPSNVAGAFNYTYKMTSSQGAGKAFDYYFRPDGVTVGMWKNRYAALSPDSGKTWTPIARIPTIIDVGAKKWGQRTKDGRYVLVYNHNPLRRRYPMVMMTSDDGYEFNNILSMQGEVPVCRYQGHAKGWGSQYIRGILPGNGNPPGKYVWVVYSMNKEDIWISRVHVPIIGKVDKYVDQNFNNVKTVADLELWNLYMPRWAPISIEPEPDGSNGKCLLMRDKDRYDYALAERVFPESKKIDVKFDLWPEQCNWGRFEVDIASRTGDKRPVQIMLNKSGIIQAVNGVDTVDLGSYKPFSKLAFDINVNAAQSKYSISIGGKEVLSNAGFAEKTDILERIVFRTGKYRGLFASKDWDHYQDVPNAGEPVKEAGYFLDNLIINK